MVQNFIDNSLDTDCDGLGLIGRGVSLEYRVNVGDKQEQQWFVEDNFEYILEWLAELVVGITMVADSWFDFTSNVWSEIDKT